MPTTILRVRPVILGVMIDACLAYADRYELDDEQTDQLIIGAVEKVRDWPEQKVIACLLRDMEPEDFYEA